MVTELEEKGIGRPSTYAAILSTLQDKEYVGKDPGKKLLPSELGLLVNDLLMESFPGIMEVDFTAGLERSLDKVEEGDVDWRQLLGEFYGPFARAVEAAKGSMRQIKGKGVKTEVACPQCGQPLLIRLGKHGEFLACSAYPGCKFTSDFTRDDKGGIVLSAPAPDPGVACDKCGAPMQLKNGRYGPFLACSAYPACKNIMNLDRDGRPQGKEEPTLLGEKCPQCGKELLIKPTRSGGKFISCSGYPKCRYSRGLPTGVNCPQCGGELVEKRSRRGKVFYGCANYPKCDYASWDRPVPESLARLLAIPSWWRRPPATSGHDALPQSGLRLREADRLPPAPSPGQRREPRRGFPKVFRKGAGKHLFHKGFPRNPARFRPTTNPGRVFGGQAAEGARAAKE